MKTYKDFDERIAQSSKKQVNNNISEQDIIDSYAATRSLRKTSSGCGVSIQVVRRILVTAGIYASDLTEEINLMYNSGKTIAEIARSFGIREKSVLNHLPYSRKSYCIGDKTVNAQRIADWRQNAHSVKSAQQQEKTSLK